MINRNSVAAAALVAGLGVAAIYAARRFGILGGAAAAGAGFLAVDAVAGRVGSSGGTSGVIDAGRTINGRIFDGQGSNGLPASF